MNAIPRQTIDWAAGPQHDEGQSMREIGVNRACQRSCGKCNATWGGITRAPWVNAEGDLTCHGSDRQAHIGRPLANALSGLKARGA
ncbi:MAG: hypothetical protein ACLPXB_18335 [Thiobacillaceae bacterium]